MHTKAPSAGRGRRAAIALAAVALLGTGGALGQTAAPPGPVMERPRPLLDPDGLRAGSFRLLPSVGAEARFDDNIFASPTQEESDLIIALRPRASLESDWSRHELAAVAEAEIYRYTDTPSEDYENWRIGADGALDLRDGRLEGSVSHADLREGRTSPDDRRGLERNRFTRDTLFGRYSHRSGRFLIRGDAELERLDFEDTPQVGGGVIDNDDRDRDETNLGLRVAREMSPDYALFAEARLNEIDFDQPFDRFGFQRSSEGYEVRGGATIDLSGKTSGEFFVGYLEADFDDPRFENASGAVFGADLTWNPTGLTTVTVTGSRTLERTTIEGASGIFTTRLAARIDHELLRQLLLTLAVEGRTEDFDGTPREDDISDFTLGGRYLANRWLYLDFGYRREERDTSPSDSGGRQFTINALYLSLVGQL